MTNNLNPAMSAVLEFLAANPGLLAENVDLNDAARQFASATAERETRSILARKRSSDANVKTADLVLAIFDLAAKVSDYVSTTPGDKNASRGDTRADKKMLSVPTPDGTLKIALLLGE